VTCIWEGCEAQLQGGHKVGENSRLFQSHNYTFPEVIATKRLAIWQHVGRFLAIFSPRMRRNGYFSWHLLGRVATPWDHNDPVYPVNSCFMQILDHTKIILSVIIFPQGCTKFPENSMSFPGSENSLSIPGFQVFPGLWPPWTVIQIKSRAQVDICLELHKGGWFCHSTVFNLGLQKQHLLGFQLTFFITKFCGPSLWNTAVSYRCSSDEECQLEADILHHCSQTIWLCAQQLLDRLYIGMAGSKATSDYLCYT